MVQNQLLVTEFTKNSKQSLPERFFTKYSSIKKPQKVACRIEEYRFCSVEMRKFIVAPHRLRNKEVIAIASLNI
ncbi:MAG: hypothetical protein HC820_08515 [Hydrococcus sp. RM1_1_31]|nr:hypothetical protein [Hydrococcus sp. RM1_1_31]